MCDFLLGVLAIADDLVGLVTSAEFARALLGATVIVGFLLAGTALVAGILMAARVVLAAVVRIAVKLVTCGKVVDRGGAK